MKQILCGVLVMLVAATVAEAFTFTEVWTTAADGSTVGPARRMGYDPVSDSVFLGDTVTTTPSVACRNAATGAALPPVPPKLPTAGLSFGSLGLWAMAGDSASPSSGKIYGYSNLGTAPGDLTVWNSLTDNAPTQHGYAGGFTRNMFIVGERIYSTGGADNGSIIITEPDINGDWVQKYTMIGGVGAKSGVTATKDGSVVYGANCSSGSPLDGVSQFVYNSGTDSYDFVGNLSLTSPIDGLEIQPNDVAIDEDLNIMFVLDGNVDEQIHMFSLRGPNPGDEVYYASFAPTGVTDMRLYYGSLEIDQDSKELYWMAVDQVVTTDVDYGKVTYTPEPASLALLALGGLALLRRR